MDAIFLLSTVFQGFGVLRNFRFSLDNNGAPYARVLRMSKCFSPNLAWALKPSLSNIVTVPNQRAQDPPSLEVDGYASTIPHLALESSPTWPSRQLLLHPFS